MESFVEITSPRNSRISCLDALQYIHKLFNIAKTQITQFLSISKETFRSTEVEAPNSYGI